MKFLTSKRSRWSGFYKKEEGALWWWQYYEAVRRDFYLFGIPVWSRLIARADRPTHKFLRKVFS